MYGPTILLDPTGSSLSGESGRRDDTSGAHETGNTTSWDDEERLETCRVVEEMLPPLQSADARRSEFGPAGNVASLVPHTRKSHWYMAELDVDCSSTHKYAVTSIKKNISTQRRGNGLPLCSVAHSIAAHHEGLAPPKEGPVPRPRIRVGGRDHQP